MKPFPREANNRTFGTRVYIRGNDEVGGTYELDRKTERTREREMAVWASYGRERSMAPVR